MEPLQLSKYELHIITICYLDYIGKHPDTDAPSQQDRETIADKLAVFLGQLPTDAKVIVSLDTTQNGS